MAKKKTQNKQKNISKQIDNMSNSNKEWMKIVRILLIVFCFLGIFYLLTVYITNNSGDSTSSTKENDSTETEIQYDKILAGSSFSLNDSEYLVIYYDNSDEELSSEISTQLSTYSGEYNVYTVDLSSAFNKKFISDGEVNRSPKDVSELSLNSPTLIKFKDGVVVDYVESIDSIVEYLG